MQIKAFIKDLAFVQVVNFFVKPLWVLLVDRIVQNELGEELYGAYYGAFALAAMFYIITDLGLNNYLIKSAFDQEGNGNNFLANSYRLKLLLSVIFLALVVYVGYANGIAFNLLIWVGVNQVLLSLSQYLRVWFNIAHQFRKESLIGVLDRLIAIGLWLAVYYLLTPSLNVLIYYFLGVQSLGYIGAILVSIYYIYKGQKNSEKAAYIDLKTIVLHCLPFTLLAFFMALFTRINIPLMDYFIPYDIAYHKGVYAQGDVILNAGNMMAAIVGAMLLPIFSKLIKEQKPVWSILKLSTLILGGSGMVLLLGIAWFDEPFYAAYYKEDALLSLDFQYKLNTFSTVLKAYIPMALTYVFGTYLTALGKLRFLIVLSIITLVLNIVLNWWLQPQFMAYGAAIAALFSQTVFCLSCIIYSLKILRF